MDVFTVLAEPTRRSIVEMLAIKGRLSATEICEGFDSSPAAISQHLKALREAKVVKVEKRGRKRIYQISTPAIREMDEWIHRMSGLWTARLDRLDKLFKNMPVKNGRTTTGRS